MRKTILLATTAFGLLGGTAVAQQILEPDSPVDGVLSKVDDRLGSGEFLDRYEFTGRAGDQVSLRMTSPDFDTYLMVEGPGDFSEQNDDGSEGDTSAALSLRLPADGAYQVTATSYEPGELGQYSLEFSTGDGTGPAAAGPLPDDERPSGDYLEPGATVREALQRGDATLNSGEYADTWRVRGRRGESYTLSLESSDFDTYLIVRGPGGLSEDNDDDPEQRGSTNSRVTFTMPANGDVDVSATTYEVGETGSYSLILEEGSARNGDDAQATAEADGQIDVGETVDGELSQGATELPSGEYANIFTLNGSQGQQLDLSLTSREFDPYLQIDGPNDFTAYNDDDPEQADSRDSRLVVTLPTDGVYRIMATSYEPGESGLYQLSVRDGAGYQPPPSPGNSAGGDPQETVIAIGDTVDGLLQSGDDTLESGEYVDNFRFQAERGQRVAVELTSSAFDAYIMLTSPSGEQIDNDDGEDGTNSQLNTVLAESGEYSVAVTSYSPGETGSYRLSVAPSLGSPRQAAVQGGARIFAIMVGVSDYDGAQTDLAYTDEDALKLAETLSREGVLNPASVTLTNAEATVGGVREAFRQAAAEAGPDDVFLFFFSGHGGQTETADGSFSVVEPDGRGESIVLRDGELSDVEMAQLFGAMRTRLSLLVLDSCFSGGFARNVVDRPGVMGLFSSEEDLTSAVADKFQAGGYLAHFLRAGLSGEADDDGDQMVTAGELATYLRRQFTTEVDGVQAETVEGQRNYQNLVIDRGGVQIDDVVIRLAGSAASTTGGL
jgi:hypothetical protein